MKQAEAEVQQASTTKMVFVPCQVHVGLLLTPN